MSIDHLGLEAAALPVLLPLVERGARVKATGFSRVDFTPADLALLAVRWQNARNFYRLERT